MDDHIRKIVVANTMRRAIVQIQNTNVHTARPMRGAIPRAQNFAFRHSFARSTHRILREGSSGKIKMCVSLTQTWLPSGMPVREPGAVEKVSKRGVAKRGSLEERVAMRVQKTVGGGGGRHAGVYNQQAMAGPPSCGAGAGLQMNTPVPGEGRNTSP